LAQIAYLSSNMNHATGVQLAYNNISQISVYFGLASLTYQIHQASILSTNICSKYILESIPFGITT